MSITLIAYSYAELRIPLCVCIYDLLKEKRFLIAWFEFN